MSKRAEQFFVALNAYNARDKEAWLGFADPQMENYPPREWPEARVITGAGEVWDFLVENFETFDAAGIELAGPIEEGDDIVVTPLRADVRGKESGVELEWAYFMVTTFRDDKAVRLDWFADRDEALEYAGIKPGAAPA